MFPKMFLLSHPQSPCSGLLTLATLASGGGVIPITPHCGGGGPVCCVVFGSIPGLYLLDTSSIIPTSQCRNTPNHRQTLPNVPEGHLRLWVRTTVLDHQV